MVSDDCLPNHASVKVVNSLPGYVLNRKMTFLHYHVKLMKIPAGNWGQWTLVLNV